MNRITWKTTELIACLILLACSVQSLRIGDARAVWLHGIGAVVFLVGFLTSSKEAKPSRLQRAMSYIAWPVLVLLVIQTLYVS